MTMQRVKGFIAYSCDECPETVETGEEGDAREAWAEARGQGWVAFKDSKGNWVHHCPSCAEES